jgi:hypothetical protein
MTESKIQSKIIAYLENLGAYVVKVGLANKNGVADLLACFKGYFIAFEVKRPGEQPKPLQVYNAKLVRDAGGTSHVVTSVEEVKHIMELGLWHA